MSRKIHSADALLRQYVETKSLLYSAGSSLQSLIAHSGGIAKRSCSEKKCAGKPWISPSDGIMRCSRCSRIWPIEQKDLGRNEFDDTRRGVRSIGERRVRLGDFAVILKHVQERVPWAFVAWCVHVLAPTREADDTGPAEGLGVPLDLVPERMQKLRRAGEIEAPSGITIYGVRKWIGQARAETMRQVWISGL